MDFRKFIAVALSATVFTTLGHSAISQTQRLYPHPRHHLRLTKHRVYQNRGVWVRIPTVVGAPMGGAPLYYFGGGYLPGYGAAFPYYSGGYSPGYGCPFDYHFQNGYCYPN